MTLRKKDNWELWDGAHPSEMGCSHENRPICDCKYHVVYRGSNEIHTFDSFQEAETFYCSKTGEKTFADLIIKKI